MSDSAQGLAGVHGDRAEEMQCVRIAQIGGEDLLVDGLGFAEAAGLLVAEGEVQGLVGGYGVHGRKRKFTAEARRTRRETSPADYG